MIFSDAISLFGQLKRMQRSKIAAVGRIKLVGLEAHDIFILIDLYVSELKLTQEIDKAHRNFTIVRTPEYVDKYMES